MHLLQYGVLQQTTLPCQRNVLYWCSGPANWLCRQPSIVCWESHARGVALQPVRPLRNVGRDNMAAPKIGGGGRERVVHSTDSFPLFSPVVKQTPQYYEDERLTIQEHHFVQ